MLSFAVIFLFKPAKAAYGQIFFQILNQFISLMVLANVEMCKGIVLSVQKHCDGCSKDIMISVLH